MDEVGGAATLITSPVMRLNRRYVTEITDGLGARAAKLGLTRSEYTTTSCATTCANSDSRFTEGDPWRTSDFTSAGS